MRYKSIRYRRIKYMHSKNLCLRNIVPVKTHNLILMTTSFKLQLQISRFKCNQTPISQTTKKQQLVISHTVLLQFVCCKLVHSSYLIDSGASTTTALSKIGALSKVAAFSLSMSTDQCIQDKDISFLKNGFSMQDIYQNCVILSEL